MDSNCHQTDSSDTNGFNAADVFYKHSTQLAPLLLLLRFSSRKRNPLFIPSLNSSSTNPPISILLQHINSTNHDFPQEQQTPFFIPSLLQQKPLISTLLKLANPSMATSDDSSPIPSSEAVDREIMENAAIALGRRSKKVALKHLRKLCKEHSDTGILYHCEAKVLENSSYSATDETEKKKLLEDAISASKKAIECSPKSIEFSFYLGYLLYGISTEVGDFEDALQQFNKALKIELPTDPLEDTIGSKGMALKFPTYQERIQNVRETILEHIGKCVLELKARNIDGRSIRGMLRNLEATTQEKVSLYWVVLSLRVKRKLLRIDVNYLKSHLKSEIEREILAEALIFFQDHKKWSFWGCCNCKETFPTPELHFSHVSEKHLKDFFAILVRRYILGISEWVPIIMNETWTPTDTNVFENKQTTLESSSELYPSSSKGILKEIQNGLKELLSRSCLLGIHMDMLIKQAISKLDSRFVALLTNLCLEKTHYCFGLLNASQLKEILKYTKEMIDFTVKNYKKESVPEEKLGFTLLDFGINGVISLSRDSFHLLLDENSLSNQFTIGDSSNEDKCSDKNPAVTSDPTGARPPGVHDLLPWLYSGLSSVEDTIRWTNLKYERTLQGQKELLKYEKRMLEGFKKIKEFQKGLSVDGKKIDSGHSSAEGLTESRNLEDQRRFQGKEELLKYEKRPSEDLKRIEELEKGLSVDGKHIDFSLQQPHNKSENCYSELSKRDQLVLELALHVPDLEDILNHYAYNGYEQIVLSIVKSYIREKLEGMMDNDTTKNKSDAAAGVLIANQSG